MTFFLFSRLYNLFGDFMKQTVKILVFSSLIGTVLAIVFFGSIKNKAEAKSMPVVSAFQVGVFKSLENAEHLKNNYPYAKIIKDNNLYRVLIGVTINNKEILKNIFKEKEYEFYIKDIKVSEELFNNLVKYDDLFTKSSKENQEAILKTMLESFLDEL